MLMLLHASYTAEEMVGRLECICERFTASPDARTASLSSYSSGRRTRPVGAFG